MEDDEADVLEQLAVEHRSLTSRSRELRCATDRDDLITLATAVVEHELVHRLLEHPLLRRDERGRMLFEERREEQLLLADRLVRALEGTQGTRTIAAFDDEFAAHTDREEILSLPHARREATTDELARLGELRRRLRPLCLDALEEDPQLITRGQWATAPRHRLPDLLGLPSELVDELPFADTRRTTASR